MTIRQNEILREVPPDGAFHFYTGIDRPIIVSANSLTDLLTKIRSVPVESVGFHTSRGDFENWIRMLGDETLAQQMAKLGTESREALRKHSIQVLEARHKELTKASSDMTTPSDRNRPSEQTQRRKNSSYQRSNPGKIARKPTR